LPVVLYEYSQTDISVRYTRGIWNNLMLVYSGSKASGPWSWPLTFF